MAILRFGLFEDFKSAPRMLLLWGDREGLMEFQKMLNELAVGKRELSALHAMDWARSAADLEMTLEVVAPVSKAALCIDSSAAGTSVRWSETREDFGRYSELISALLIAPASRGHQYLDSDRRGEAKVMVSAGEYPDELTP